MSKWQSVGCRRKAPLLAKDARNGAPGELLNDLDVYPYTKETALLAGQIDGEQHNRGITIPFADLLIGATALQVRYSLLTVNVRHFQVIPSLTVIPL